MMDNRYGPLAALIYHLDKPPGRSFGDIAFYRERLSDCRDALLEPAVGNGRVMIPLLEAGFAVDGFDRSEAMLALCRCECSSRGLSPRLSHAGFDDFRPERPYRAILLPAGTVHLIEDADAALRVLRRFHDALLPGGRLLIDLDPVDGVRAPGGSARRWTAPDGDVLVLHQEPPLIDHAARRVVRALRYERWRGPGLVEVETDALTMRWWEVAEFADALVSAGFEAPVISGNHEHGRPPRAGDRVWTFEARKASAETVTAPARGPRS